MNQTKQSSDRFQRREITRMAGIRAIGHDACSGFRAERCDKPVLSHLLLDWHEAAIGHHQCCLQEGYYYVGG